MDLTFKNISVIAVVVTYNRLPLLQQVLQALRKQTYIIDHLVVVNNSSTDGTGEWLALQPKLTVIDQENSGGSGGFSTGVKKAMETTADWIWLMDDDILPAPDCLEKLLSYSQLSSCLHPVHLDTEGNLLEEERWFDPTDVTIRSLFNQSYKSGKKIWYRNIGCFEGMLIHRSIVEKIGLPDTRFFITHDDLIYGYLAHSHTNVLVTAEAVMQKIPRTVTPAGVYCELYYRFRNLWLLEAYAEAAVPGFTGYRKRRIRLQFLYELYRIMKNKVYPNRLLAIRFLWAAFRDYRTKKEGKCPL